MNKLSFRHNLPGVKTIVVKVGSRIVTAEQNLLRRKRIRSLVEDITALRAARINVLLVSSGAIAHGIQVLGLRARPRSIPMQQACASVGQIRLMRMYESLFTRQRVPVGQVLLSWDDLRDKQRYLNLRNTLFTLIKNKTVPIINENDSVGINEIKFGDNDTLCAQIANLVGADLLVILTNINGLYDSDPKNNPHAGHIPEVRRITPALHRLAQCGSPTGPGVGGMATKLRATEIVCKAGIPVIIGNGFDARLREVLADHNVGTLFLPSARRMSSKRRWIAFTGKAKGVVTVDDGARSAICLRGKSLLPAGIVDVEGEFRVGDMVDIRDNSRAVFARGMVNYQSGDLHKIKGRRTNDIAAVLGGNSFDMAIHRDNLVLT